MRAVRKRAQGIQRGSEREESGPSRADPRPSSPAQSGLTGVEPCVGARRLCVPVGAPRLWTGSRCMTLHIVH